MVKENETLKVVIVDDEERSCHILKQLMEEYVENIEVVALADDVLSGVKAINQHHPDVVFLDIEMPSYSGFKLVEYFDEINFDLVFITAYEKYAIKAYKVSAIGYLLKPVDIDDLILVFEKIAAKRKKSNIQNISSEDKKQSGRIIFPTPNGLIYLYLEEICYLESQGRYTTINLVNSQQLICTLSLKDCLVKLKNATFIQVHRSFIINLTYIKSYARGRDSYIILDNDHRVDVGLHYKETLNNAVSKFLR